MIDFDGGEGGALPFDDENIQSLGALPGLLEQAITLDVPPHRDDFWAAKFARALGKSKDLVALRFWGENWRDKDDKFARNLPVNLGQLDLHGLSLDVDIWANGMKRLDALCVLKVHACKFGGQGAPNERLKDFLLFALEIPTLSSLDVAPHIEDGAVKALESAVKTRSERCKDPSRAQSVFEKGIFPQEIVFRLKKERITWPGLSDILSHFSGAGCEFLRLLVPRMGPIPDVLHAKSIGSGVGRMSQTPVAVLPICEKETQAEITTKATSCNESARIFFGETPESSELRPWTAPSQLGHHQHLPVHVKSATDDEDVANFAMKVYGAHSPYASNAAERFDYWISRRSLALAALAARSPAHRESRARTRLALAFALRSDLWPLRAIKINREELAKLFLAAEAESVAELAPKLDAYTLFEKLKVNCHWQLDTRGADAINAAALDELFPEPDLHGLLDADRLRAQLLRARAFFDAAKTRFLGKDTMRILEYLVALGEGPSPLPSLRKQRAAVRTAEAEVEVAIKAARREGSNAHLEALRARVSERDEAREALLSALLKAGGDRTAQEADWLRASISRARAAFFCSDDKNLPRPDRGAATRALDWATKLPRRVVRAQKKTDKAWEAAQSPGAKRGALGLPSEQLLEAAVGAMSEERQEYEKSAFGGMSSKLLREAISAAVECVGDADSAPEARREELERLECALEPISLEPLWKLLGDVDDVRVIQQRIELEILELNVKKRRRGAEVDEGEEEKRLAKIDELERRRAELPSVVALDRKICHERAALLLRAERYRPELLCDPKWRDDLNIASEDLVGVGRMDLLLAHAKLSDFERVGSLGSGAKEVHKVRHFEAGKMSVIKVFHLGAAGAQRRFFRQVSELARLRSAHVIRVEGVFLADAMHGCVLFPFCEGGDLGAWISANAGAGQDERKRIAREVLMGLCDLHVERLVHCDIKPSNIFLAADGTVVLGDFDGVQRADVSLTQPMQATADFMAPELRADPTRVGPPADIYSTGMVLRQLFREEREPAMEELIAAMCAEDPLARPTASEARKHAAFRSAPVSASTCLICCDESTSGLSCGDPAHFVCRGCLGDAVQSAVAGDAASSVKITRGGEMACFTPTCGGCLPARELASTLRPDDFAAWMRAVRSAVEREVRVSAQLRPAGSVHEHVNHISSKLLVNSCPACGAAFHDFEGCLALQCSNCSTYVCGWCFQGFPASRTGKSACHTHVARCPSVSDQWRRIYWAEDMDLVHKQWGILRAKRVREYLESLPEPTRAEVFDAVQPLLTDDVMRGAEVFGDEKEDAGEEDAEEYDDVIEIE